MRVEHANQVRFWLILAVTLLLVACSEAASDDAAIPLGSEPALKPAPTRQSITEPSPPAAPVIVPLATDTPGVVGPPTGTPTPLPTEPAAGEQLQVAAATPKPVTAANPPASQSQPATVEPSSLIRGVDCEAQIEAYLEHLTADRTLANYEALTVAACRLEQGERPAAIEVYKTAVEDGVDRVTEVLLRQALADLLIEDGDYPAALAQYEAILSLAETDVTRGRTLYQAGQTALLAGNHQAGYARLLTLVHDYPQASESFQALTELIAAGYEVDYFQQGLVAYNAQVYDVAVDAFGRAIESNPNSGQDAHLYLAWSLEKLGDVDGALAQLDGHIAAEEAAGVGADAARGRMERAKMQVRAGRTQGALDDYQAYLARYPDGEQAPQAAWQSAALAEELGYLTRATERFLAYAESYPKRNDAAEALFRAGRLFWQLDEQDEASTTWRRALETYPENEYGSAALLWLLTTAPAEDIAELEALAADNEGYGYYAQRVRHLVNGVEPFVSAPTADLNPGDTGREFAERWLREWLGQGGGENVSELSDTLAADARLKHGETLWQLGQRGEATRLFESLRADFAGDALASYQLALYFRDLGLHRSSLLAATSLMALAGVDVSSAPRFIARLAYPAYHADLIAAEAQRYGYDPLLQLALIREESYFDTLATSPLGAQGMSQILPETGAYIAGRPGQADYQNGDLYRPEVAIPFGAFLLDQQLDRYDGNVAAALAAYNAGPDFADQWAQQEPDDFDRYLEVVDFPETQRYIKQMYVTHAIYRFLYG